jgi:hypothetical protein
MLHAIQSKGREIKMVKITKVSVLKNYCLELVFDDGICGVVDLSDLAGKGVFNLWNDPHVFEQVKIGSFGELVWLDKIDLCPDALYLKATGKKPEKIFSGLRCESVYA